MLWKRRLSEAYEGDEVMVPQTWLPWKYSWPGTREVESSESSQRTNKKDKGAWLVATYHPLLQNIDRIFLRHLDLLYIDQDVQRVFTLGPMASFHSAQKISSYLVRAKLYPLERRVGLTVEVGVGRFV